MDQIFISGLKVQGILGIDAHERLTPQTILINIILFANLMKAGEFDEIGYSVDYREIAQKVKTLAETAQRYSVEALALDIVRLCLTEPLVLKVRVRVEKPEALDFVETVGVELEVGRDNIV